MAYLKSEIMSMKRLSSSLMVVYLDDNDATGTIRNLHMELVLCGSTAKVR
jgi:hypothetical protein